MPRPARAMWVTRKYARRRHRSWMLSMTFASLGWGTWWILLLVRKIRGEMPDLLLPEVISCSFAVVGLILAFWCLRGRRSWLMFVMVPVLANGSLLMMPELAFDILR